MCEIRCMQIAFSKSEVDSSSSSGSSSSSSSSSSSAFIKKKNCPATFKTSLEGLLSRSVCLND